MSKITMSKFRTIILINIFILISMGIINCASKSDWLMKIEGDTVYVSDFEAAYDAFLLMQAQSFQVSLEELKSFIADPSLAPDESLKPILQSMTKHSFVDNYKTFLLANIEAKENGFTKRPDIKRKMKFINEFFLASFYLEEQVPDGKFKVTHEETVKAWEEIRRKNPQYVRVPLEQGLKLTERSLTQQKKQQVISEKFKGLIQKYKIEENPESSVTSTPLDDMGSETSTSKNTEVDTKSETSQK